MNHSVASDFKKGKKNESDMPAPIAPTLLRPPEAEDKKPTPASPSSYSEMLISAEGHETEYVTDALGFGVVSLQCP